MKRWGLNTDTGNIFNFSKMNKILEDLLLIELGGLLYKHENTFD
jgi:hypothetical protein